MKSRNLKIKFCLRSLCLFGLFVFTESSNTLGNVQARNEGMDSYWSWSLQLSKLPVLSSAPYTQELWTPVSCILPLGLGCWSHVLDVQILSGEDLPFTSYWAFLPALRYSQQCCSTAWEILLRIFSDFGWLSEFSLLMQVKKGKWWFFFFLFTILYVS